MRARWPALPLRRRQRLAWGLGVAALLLFPVVDLFFNLQLLNAVTDAAVFVILALGLNIVVGYAGLLDLGYAAFFAIGAYTTGILTWPPHGLELNFWWAMWLERAGGSLVRRAHRGPDAACARGLSGHYYAGLWGNRAHCLSESLADRSAPWSLGYW